MVSCGGGDAVAPAHTEAVAPTIAPAPTATPMPVTTATPVATATPIPTPIPTATSVPTATPTERPTSTPRPTPAPASIVATSSAGVYAQVSPSVVFVETQTGTGSGVLIEGGYVLTNFHVVWPSEEVQVVFPDGFTVENAPVAAWDPMADIALLGPVEDAPAPPLELHDGESLPIGSELLQVGYPAEAESFPQPSITRGILSRVREWEQLGMTYFQTDAAITGGQSGGALVNANGEVIGISGFKFSDAGFGLVASAADIAPIAERLIDGQDPLGLNSRFFDGKPGFDFDVDIHNYWDVKSFVADVSGADEVEFEIDGPGDGWLYVSDPFGQTILSVNYEYTGIERGSVELFDENTLFVNVTISTGESSSFDLTSSIALYPINDPDDGQTIAAGETVAGSIDHHEDIDWYSIYLQEGETIEISANSLNVDTYLFVDFPNSRDNQVVSDDDSGGGLFETDSELIYRALQTGEYYIAVRDAAAYSVGGYYLSVVPAPGWPRNG